MELPNPRHGFASLHQQHLGQMQWEFCFSQLTSQWEGCKPKSISLATHCCTREEGERLQTAPVAWEIPETNQKGLWGPYRFIRRLFAGELPPLCSEDEKGTLGCTSCKHGQVLGCFPFPKVAEPQSQDPVFAGPWRLYHSLPFFPFVFKIGFLLGSKTQPEEINVRGTMSVRCLLRSWHCYPKINGDTSKDKGSDFLVVWSCQWRKPISQTL